MGPEPTQAAGKPVSRCVTVTESVNVRQVEYYSAESYFSNESADPATRVGHEQLRHVGANQRSVQSRTQRLDSGGSMSYSTQTSINEWWVRISSISVSVYPRLSSVPATR